MKDPEEERWHKKYPNFPGVHKCVELLRSPNVTGTWIDTICMELQDHAADYFAELVEAIQSETDERVKILLLAALAEAGLPEAVPVLIESLRSSLEGLEYWAQFGLEKVGTKEARAALWAYRHTV